MRSVLVRILLFPILMVSGIVARGQGPSGPKASPSETAEAARADEAAVIARKAAEAYTITQEKPGSAPLTLEPKSLLRWSNPVSGSFHGSVFVWAAKGRPEVVASIYKWYSATPHLGVEFHLLATGPVTAQRGGRPEWTPGRAGVAFRPVEGAPAPASTPARRLRQLRELAQQFTAAETDRKEITRTLRLLSKPLYRYESTDPQVLDGALFTFTEGTDTEVFLLIEARKAGAGAETAWNYALARMNSVALRVAHRGREVWSVPTLSWDQTFDAKEPYTLLVFKPGAGVNPPESVVGP